MADETHVDVRSPSRLAHMRLKVRELVWEARFLARLGQTWPERMSIAKLVAMLYAARLMPFETYRWEATILVRGAKYVVGVRTSEIFIFHEIYESLQYQRHADFIRRAAGPFSTSAANIGVFTVLQATQGARVYSFRTEPRLVRQAVAKCRCEQVERPRATVSDGARRRARDGSFARDKRGHHRRRGDTSQGGGVRSRRPDCHARRGRFHGARSSIDLLKIDAEGSEVAILRGGERTLDHVQRIMVEFHSRGPLAPGGRNPRSQRICAGNDRRLLR